MTKRVLIVHNGTGRVGNSLPTCKTENEPEQPVNYTCPAGYKVEPPMLPLIPEDIKEKSRLQARLNCNCEDCMKKEEQPMLYTQQNGRRNK